MKYFEFQLIHLLAQRFCCPKTRIVFCPHYLLVDNVSVSSGFVRFFQLFNFQRAFLNCFLVERRLATAFIYQHISFALSTPFSNLFNSFFQIWQVLAVRADDFDIIPPPSTSCQLLFLLFSRFFYLFFYLFNNIIKKPLPEYLSEHSSNDFFVQLLSILPLHMNELYMVSNIFKY